MGGIPYKVLIPTSGVGSALGDTVRYMNKSLIKVGKKPTISYIFDAFPAEIEFVITLGHFGDQIREFIELVHADRRCTFVEVDRYDGPGSSLGYSMLQASAALQCPFVYHASDTIVTERIPEPSRNWIGGCPGEGSSQYASFNVIGDRVQSLSHKGQVQSDFLHIGIIGIHDFEAFWDVLQRVHAQAPDDETLGDVAVMKQLLHQQKEFRVQPFTTWYDVGNIDSLNRVRKEIPDSFRILDKLGEATYIMDNAVVKFFHDETLVEHRVHRGRALSGLVPEILGSSSHFYRYRFIEGRLFSKVVTPTLFQEFLQWADERLWTPVREVDADHFLSTCRDFYERKTLKRIAQFHETRGVCDRAQCINGEQVPTVDDMLRMIDFDWLCRAEQSQFHGDFILDNIIRTKDGFSLLDWRQDFAGLLEAGDRYYDFGKLNHNLTVNHEIINNDQFVIDVDGDEVRCDILRHQNHVECQRVLFDFLARGGYDAKKVRVLTGLIWLNMSPLHHHPFDLFLYYFGKLNLWQALND